MHIRIKQDERNDRLKKLKTLEKDVLRTLVENKHRVGGLASEKQAAIWLTAFPLKIMQLYF